MYQSESCNTWTEAGFHSPTVSAARLMVPGKAASEYQKACGALKDKKFSEAEGHVRRALDVYPNYAAAWVLLGQILEKQNKRGDARAACSQAMRVDSSYVPPYLCLADFAASEGDWDQVSVLTDRAQKLDPVSDPFTFYFTAYTQFHFHQLHQAEANAEAALKLDIWHHAPELHYLMAQICQAKGDLRKEAMELREYLKLAPNSANAEQAKTLLAQIDVRPPR
jgi:tetratricopeptide (TPR) repeat protein